MIKIEPFSKEDFSKLVSWIDSAETLVQFSGPVFIFPLTNQQLETYISEPSRYAFKVVSTEDNNTIGHAEVYLMENNIAKLCRILVGAKNERGKGIGQKIVFEVLNFSFFKLGVDLAELNVYDWNISAIKCYEKVGFVMVKGKTKTTQVNGKSWTSINMKIDKSKWKQVQYEKHTKEARQEIK